MLRTIAFSLMTLTALGAHAATLIELKTPDGLTRIYTDEARARMNLPDRSYMLVDSAAGTLKLVMPRERRVMDMSHALASAPDRPGGASVDFDKTGSGPRVAGYRTTSYRYSAGGKVCGEVLASQKALEDSGLEEAFQVMQRMAAHANAMAQRFNRNTDPCEQASNDFSAHVKDIGIPMRVTHSSGMLVSEIVRIETDTKLPANTFVIPAGYQSQDTGQMMREAEKQLRQLEGAGQIPPELMERLRQMQQQQQR